MKKTKRKLLATLLAFTMLFGSSMTVFAANYEWSSLTIGQTLTDQDTIVWYKDNCYGEQNLKVYGSSSGTLSDSEEGSGYSVTLTVQVPNGKVWTVDRKESPSPTDTSDPHIYEVYVTETDAVPSSRPTTPSVDPVEEPTKIEEVHSHSYSWVTVQEAGAGQDGIEEYRCSCGAVAERNVIPAGMAMVKDLVRQIETAPENSTVEIKTEYFTCYTAYIMNALRKRPDVSLKTTFKDYDKDGSIKTFTIPAGKVPDDNELFYGFTYLGNLYGWDE